MGDQYTFEDVIRAVARRRLLVAVTIVGLALLGAAYGKLTTASAAFTAEASFSVGQANAVALGPDDPLEADRSTAGAEADRLAALLVQLAGPAYEDITVRPTASNSAVIVKAAGETAAEAEGLAIETAQAFIDLRRTQGREPYAAQAAARSAQAVALTDQIAALDERLDAAAGTGATALELQRVQLVDQKFQAEQAAATATSNAERFDAGLSAPVLVEPALASGRSGWVVFGVVGAILGAMVGVGAALLLASVDHRIRSRFDAERVASGVPIIGVLPRGRRDEDELEVVEARVRGLASGQPIVFVAGAPADGATPGLVDALTRGAGAVDVVARVTGNETRAVVVGVRSGASKDVDLAATLSDLAARDTPVLGLLIWDVPTRSLDWARRPLVLRN